MANYTYIILQKPLTKEAFEAELQASVSSYFGDKMFVTRADWGERGASWRVIAPGTEPPTWQVAVERMQAMGEPFGFSVSLIERGYKIAFRQFAQPFERWAQGVIEEVIAERLEAPIYFDVTAESFPPGTRTYREGDTFLGNLACKFERPLREDVVEYLRDRAALAPDWAQDESGLGLEVKAASC